MGSPHYNFATVHCVNSTVYDTKLLMSFAYNRRLLMNTTLREEFENPPEYLLIALYSTDFCYQDLFHDTYQWGIWKNRNLPPENSLKPYSKLSLDVKTRLVAEQFLFIYQWPMIWQSNDTWRITMIWRSNDTWRIGNGQWYLKNWPGKSSCSSFLETRTWLGIFLKWFPSLRFGNKRSATSCARCLD